MGAYDGMVESTSWFFERCLGWRGILIEAHPQHFQSILINRPATLNIRMAACPKHGLIKYTGITGTWARTEKNLEPNWAPKSTPISVQCGPINDYFELLGVHRIDFFSLDVEGSELDVIRSLFDPARTVLRHISVGVLMIEVRGDGQRANIHSTLLARGFRYAGQIFGRPSPANEIIDDVFLNLSHMKVFFPQSCLHTATCDHRSYHPTRSLKPRFHSQGGSNLHNVSALHEKTNNHSVRLEKAPRYKVRNLHAKSLDPMKHSSTESNPLDYLRLAFERLIN